MTREQTLVIYKKIRVQNYAKCLNSRDKESDGTQFCRLELPQPSYHSINTPEVFMKCVFTVSFMMALY